MENKYNRQVCATCTKAKAEADGWKCCKEANLGLITDTPADFHCAEWTGIDKEMIRAKKAPRLNLIGAKIGKLEVIAYSHRAPSGQHYWKCRCECGREIFASRNVLTSHRISSCGCAYIGGHIRGGQTRTLYTKIARMALGRDIEGKDAIDRAIARADQALIAALGAEMRPALRRLLNQYTDELVAVARESIAGNKA